MLFGSGRWVEVAKALINLYCSPKGITKRRRIQSLVKTGAKPSVIPKPPEPRPTGPAAGAPKDPAPMTAVATSTLAAGAEEGEVLVGETLLSLRGGDFPSGSSALPSDKEVEMLEGLNFDETGKLRFFVFRELGLFVTLVKKGPLFIAFAAVSASMKQLLAVMHGP